MVIYREAEKEDLAEVAVLLTESFRGYAFFEMYSPSRKERQNQFFHAIQEVSTKAFFKKHITLLGIQDKKIVSVAQLKAPDTPDISLLDYVLSGGIKILIAGGHFNTFGLLRMLDKASSICHNLPGRVWYLNSLAVSKSCQGQGLGSKIITDCIIPYIQKRDGGLLTLITNSQQNRLFYKKNGFEEFHEMILRRKEKELGNWSYRMKISNHM